MDRRDFVRGAAGVAATAVGLRGQAREDRIVVDGLLANIYLLDEPYLRSLQSARVNCVHITMNDLLSAGLLYDFLDRHGQEIRRVGTVQGIRETVATGRIALVMGVQDANWLEPSFQKSGTGGTYRPLVLLRTYYELGIRIHSIAYNSTNMFGGGCLDHQVGLTRAGRRLVEEIHRLRMLLDVGAHTADRTSLDAIDISRGVPVICSHSNVAALNDNPRAVSDRLIEAIARTGGVVGLSAVSDFMVRNARSAKLHGPVSPQATLDVYLDQLDYVKRLIGADHVGLGPDFTGSTGEAFSHRAAGSLNFPEEALSDGKLRYVKGFERITELPNVVRGLEGRGWSRTEIDKLLGANWLRVYAQAWGG